MRDTFQQIRFPVILILCFSLVFQPELAQLAYGRPIVTIDPHDPCDPNVNGSETIYNILGQAVETWRWADVDINLVDLEVGSVKVGRKIPDSVEPEEAWSHGQLLSKTETRYDRASRVAQTIAYDENGAQQITEYEYDRAGKQTAVIDPLGNRTEYGYQGNRRAWVHDARGHNTWFQYDVLGRQISTIYHDQTYTWVDYDELGRRISQTDQAGRTRWFDYDIAGRLTAVILPDVNDPNNDNIPTYPRYEYEYDTYGNLITIRDNVKDYGDSTDADFARETKFTYNELGSQTSRKLPEGQTEYKEYDEFGRLIKATDFKGQVTAFIYNDTNNPGLLEYQRYYDSNDCYENHPDDPNIEIHITYDQLGRKTVVDVSDEGAESSYAYKYDAEGRITEIHSPQGFVRYGYFTSTGRKYYVYTPKLDNIEEVESKISYTYDELGRLETVQVNELNGEDANNLTDYYYNEVGSLKGVIYPNGNYAAYSYDELNRLTNLENKNASQEILSSYQYTLAPDGRRTAVTEENSTSGTTTINWTYDSLNRLTKEQYNAPGDANDYSHSYVYDLVGNRLERQVLDGNDTIYHYNNNDQLEQETTDGNNLYYDYDDNGSLTEEANDVSNLQTYSYNLQSRLASVDNGNDIVNYKYNSDGIRVQSAVVDGDTTNYLIDPYNHTGYAQVFRANIVDGASTVYVLGNDVLAQATGSDYPDYFLYDGHGSVRQLTNTNGAVVENYNFDGYGNAHGFNPAPTR